MSFLFWIVAISPLIVMSLTAYTKGQWKKFTKYMLIAGVLTTTAVFTCMMLNATYTKTNVVKIDTMLAINDEGEYLLTTQDGFYYYNTTDKHGAVETKRISSDDVSIVYTSDEAPRVVFEKRQLLVKHWWQSLVQFGFSDKCVIIYVPEGSVGK